MSYVSRPRIGFVGHDAMTNPSTANNENVIHLLDYDNVQLLNPPAVDGPALPTMSDTAYREWMTTLLTYSDPLDQLPDPNQPDWQPGMPGYWNYWGDHLTTFGSASINSLWLSDEPIFDRAEDPLLGSRVIYNARIVDVDPADTFTTQFVCARFAVLGTDRSGAPAELFAGVLTTSFTRFLNFFRPKGAGTFQSVIPNAGLTFIADDQAPDSAAFRALRDGCRAGGGLLVRHCLYAMSAATRMPQMYQQFQQGSQATNPKIGSVVGSIGVWNGSDMPSTPVGRLLHQPGPPFFAPADPAASETTASRRVKTHADVERVSAEHEAVAATGPPPTSIGPAVAVVEDDRVVLDLLTTFPEAGSGTDPLAKADYGPVALHLVDGSGSIELGAVRYDQVTYEQRAGVWEMLVPDPVIPRLANGSLRLVDSAGTVLLREIECAEIEAEQLANYVDLAPAPGGGLNATTSLTLRAFRKGAPITEPVNVRVQRFDDVQVPGKVNSVSPLVLTATEISEVKTNDDATITIPPGGVLELPVTTTEAGCFKLRFIPDGMPADPNQPQFAVEFFAAFRALPHDDYSAVPDEQITLDFVYREVFAYYAILYPIMGSIIPWGPANTPSDPDRVTQFAALIHQAVDASRLGTALQMPITREMSAGKRALVQRWCELQLTTS